MVNKLGTDRAKELGGKGGTVRWSKISKEDRSAQMRAVRKGKPKKRK